MINCVTDHMKDGNIHRMSVACSLFHVSFKTQSKSQDLCGTWVREIERINEWIRSKREVLQNLAAYI